jgi:hypothetical protein
VIQATETRPVAAALSTIGAISFYTDEVHGNRYWTFLTQELPELVHSFFRLSRRREDTFVAGLSMGGYGVAAACVRRRMNPSVTNGPSAGWRRAVSGGSIGDYFGGVPYPSSAAVCLAPSSSGTAMTAVP